MKVYVVVCHYDDWGNESCEVGCSDNCFHVVGVYTTKKKAEEEERKHEKDVASRKNMIGCPACKTLIKKNNVSKKVQCKCGFWFNEYEGYSCHIHPFDSCSTEVEEHEVKGENNEKEVNK